MRPPPAPTAVVVSTSFFAFCGVLELGLGIYDAPRPVAFWPVWEALGRAILYWLVAAGLWNRLSFCRSIAIVYCLTALVLYAVVLAMALLQAPLRYPASVVISSLLQVPSCALLLPYLRSTEAHLLFRRPLFPP
jgi:hypothetical protein